MAQEIYETVGYEGMSVDVEGVTDVATHSKLAIASFPLLLAGSLAPIAPSLAFISGFATLLAALALVLHKRKNYSYASMSIATFVVLVGSCVTAWGVTTYQTRQMKMFSQATEVAAKYMNVLSKGEMLAAIQMVGLEPPVRDIEEQELTPSQKAVRFYLEDYVINQVIKRGSAAKWEPQGIVENYRSGAAFVYKVRFIDKTRDNPIPFDVVIQHLPPSKYAAEKVNLWKVDHLEQPSKN